MTNEVKITPITEQYQAMKKNHPDAIILMRVGDFYETFGEDAIAVSEICGCTLTRRANGNSASIELAGFPYRALDTYMPKIIRAGKRVAICEQLDDGKQKAVELVTPAKTEEPEPEKKMKQTKEINCTLTAEQLKELGEPIAYFTVEIPKDVKNIGKCAENSKGWHPVMQAVCLEPERGMLIASDTYILYTADVKCSGTWPEANNNKPFQCFIDSKAIRDLAGKTVDIAVWTDENNHQKVTACEISGVLAQHTIKIGNLFPDWQRVMPKEHNAIINIDPEAVKNLRKFVKDNMGKTKKEREERCVVIHCTPEADNMQVIITDEKGEEIAVTYADLTGIQDPNYIQQCYNAELFYYSIQEDFSGEISFVEDMRPATFRGESRTSILMPKYHDVFGSYMTTENPKE